MSLQTRIRLLYVLVALDLGLVAWLLAWLWAVAS
jgi:hypothetical protein